MAGNWITAADVSALIGDDKVNRFDTTDLESELDADEDWNPVLAIQHATRGHLRGVLDPDGKWFLGAGEQAADPAPAGLAGTAGYLWPKNDHNMHWHPAGVADRTLLDTSNYGALVTALAALTVSGSLSAGNLAATDADDIDSLVPGDLAAREWDGSLAAETVRVRLAGVPSDDPAFEARLLNEDGASTGAGRRARAFVVPAGITSITASLAMKLPDGEVDQTMLLQFVDYNGDALSPPAHDTYDLTDEWVTYELTADVTPGETYYIVVATNSTLDGNDQAKALCGRMKVYGSGGTDVFAAPCSRWQVRPGRVTNNLYPDLKLKSEAGDPAGDGKGVWYLSAGSTLRFLTDANKLAADFVFTCGPDAQPQRDIEIYVNGEAFERLQISTTTIRRMGVVQSTLPTGRKLVEIRSPQQVTLSAETAGQPPSGDVAGGFLSGIYFPRSSNTVLVNEPPRHDRLVLIGDSIVSGYSADEPEQGFANYFRRHYEQRFGGDMVQHTWGGACGKSLWEDADAIEVICQLIVRSGAKRCWVALGWNDWNGAGEAGSGRWANVTEFQTQLGEFLDRINELAPWIVVYCQSPVGVVDEEAENGEGETIPDYRTAIETEANARTWCVYVDGLAALPYSADEFYVDEVHPNSRGHERFVTYALEAL